MKHRKHKKKQRFFAAFLCFCIMFTLPGISDVFPVVAAGQEQRVKVDNIIIDFLPLSEEIKEQTVSVGTDLDELNLPKELTVYLEWEQESSEQKAEEIEQENLEQESAEENADYIEETDLGDEGKNWEDGVLSNEGCSEEGSNLEDESGEEEDTNTESIEEQDEQLEKSEKEAVVEETTYTVSMPKYQAENVINMETLENVPDVEKQSETVIIEDITWKSEPEYDGNTEGIYIFTAILPNSYTLAESVSLPQITVMVQESNIDTVVLALLDRIAELPDVEEYLASEPEVEDEENYTEWEEKLYEYAEKALAIWEEYAVLMEEQQSQIAEKETAKLTVWVELAKQFSENDRVMLTDSSEHHGETGWMELSDDDIELSGGKYYLADDITMGTITIKGEVVLCLNGHTLTHSGDDSVIVVESGVFTLRDCKNDKGCITGGKGHNTGNNVTDGGGVYVCPGATFNMYGGVITGNNASSHGGGVCMRGVADNWYGFNMYGGKVVNNEAGSMGGGIYATFAYVNIAGGRVEENIVGTSGGGIQIDVGDITISNVSIVNNKAGQRGAGVFRGTNTQLFISGRVNITGNMHPDGTVDNVWIRNNAFFNVTGDLKGSAIGVTTQKEPAVEIPIKIAGGDGYTISDDDWRCFSSDNKDYEVLKKATDTGNELLLAIPGICDLGGLDLSTEGATLSPTFDSGITEYTSTVAYKVDKIGITATLADTVSDADITIKVNNGEEVQMTSGEEQEVSLDVGDNKIEITVASGEVSKIYTLIITREESKGNPVTITACKDGTEWTDNPHTYKLTSDNGTSFVTDLTAVPDGTYKIYECASSPTAADHDTRVTVKVEGAETTARVDYYTVTFYDADTVLTAPAQQIVLKGDMASEPSSTEQPTKTGYKFKEWVVRTGGQTTTFKFDTPINSQILVYADWTPIEYQIKYHLDGGTATGNPEKYTITDNAITLVNPTKTGHTFAGWSGTDLDTDKYHTSVIIASGSTGDREYTAHFTVNTYAVTLHTNEGSSGTPLTSYKYGTGATLPADWTKTGYTFAGWYDNADCTGNAVTNISNTDIGDKEYWAKWTDDIAPVIGTLEYNYEPKNLWHWLIGKESLIITVPVTEEGSGADRITYTVTPEGGTASTQTTAIAGGKAKITVSADFKGMIAIVCTDNAGNTSASVTVGAGLDATGIIIEDNAPQISALADRKPVDTSSTQPNGTALTGDYYETAPAIIVTVKDDKDNAISGGIASVSYQIGSGSVKTVDHDYTTDMVINDKFTISATEIPAGATEIQIIITATDNAGNTASETITVKIKGPEETPAATINYHTEKLKDLKPNAEYSINGTSYRTDEEGCIPIDDNWLNTTISIAKKGVGVETTDSGTQNLAIPARRTAPNAPVLSSRTDGSITLQTISNAQYRITGKNWQATTVFGGLDEKTIFSFEAYYPATDTSFASKPSDSAQIATMPKPPTLDKLAINYVGETFTLKDGVEAFKEQNCTTGISEGDVTAYIGQTIYIRYPESGINGIIPASLTTAVQIPARPAKPNVGKTDAAYPGAKDGAITGLTAGNAYEIRVKGADGNFGAWENAKLTGTKIENLSAGEYEVRAKAVKDVRFCSEATNVTIGELPGVKVTFMANGEVYAVRVMRSGGTLTDIPSVPPKKDAGNQTYASEWCADEQGNSPAVFKNITADMTVYAVYTIGYTVTLKSGTGYRLSAVSGSASPVKEGGSFTFRLKIDSNYKPADTGLAVKVNGVKVELVAEGNEIYTYSITDIRENKTVTVEGIQKKPSSGGTGDSGSPDKDPESNPPENNGPTTDGNPSTGGNPSTDSTPPTGGNPPMGSTPTIDKNPAGGNSPTGNPSIDSTKKTGTTPEEQKELGNTEEETSNSAQRTEQESTDSAQTDTNPQIKQAEITIGNGTVIVTVVCEEQKYTAAVADTEAVVNAVLTSEQRELVNSGETIEIRIDVTDISESVPVRDKEVIESGIEAYQNELPNLTLGMYIDISMFIKIGDSEWDAITATGEPVEVVIGIPEELQESGREYYIIRAHDGEYTFMEDRDDAPDTITISTNLFSSYAIAYQRTDAASMGNAEKCGLCHICPTFLGICYFIWLAIIAIAILVVVIIVLRRRKDEDAER